MSPLWLCFWIPVLAVSSAVGSGTNNIAAVAAVIFFIAAFVIYLWPVLVANRRKHLNATGIALLNVFLGWTVLGWVVAVIWAYSKGATVTQTAPTASVGPGAPETMVPQPRLCPFCAEEIKREAIKCKHCGSDVSATVQQ